MVFKYFGCTSKLLPPAVPLETWFKPNCNSTCVASCILSCENISLYQIPSLETHEGLLRWCMTNPKAKFIGSAALPFPMPLGFN